MEDGGDNLEMTTDSVLVAYRLGRLEKSVDNINTLSIARDDKILDKLAEVGHLAQEVKQNSWRIASLENSRTNVNRFLAGLGSAVILIVIEMVFNLM